MCGIAGILAPRDDPGLAARVAAMTQTLYHRGPDDGGVVAFGGDVHAAAMPLGKPHESLNWPPFPARVALGARRLSIVDLSPRGHQPMKSADGQAWIVHNGEIYNHVELRDELRATGHSFASHTDTEVILAAWLQWGRACLDRFDGMWAFAICLPRQRELILSRDRFGIKPLYYAMASGGLAFASEIKALLTLPDLPRRANPARLVDFLTEGLIDHTDETLFDGIHALPAGSSVRIRWRDDAEFDADIAWFFTARRFPLDPPAPPTFRDGISHTVHEWTNGPARLRFALDESVRMHLRSDVPVGSCLSGGIDSSSIVASLAALKQARTAPRPGAQRRAAVPHELDNPGPVWSQHTFTAVLPGDPLDESAHARAAVADNAGPHAHIVEPTAAGLLADLDRLLWHQDEPFGSPSIYMQWEVMKAARAAGVPVLLDGQGADELFCGYPGYYAPYVAQRMRRFRLREAFRFFRSPLVRKHLGVFGLSGHVAAHLLPRIRREAIRKAWRSMRHPYLCDALTAEAAAHPSSSRAALRGLSSQRSHESSHPLHHATNFEHFWWSVLLRKSLPSLLRFEDRNAMAFSIEARVPFLGRAVADLAIDCPAGLKLAGGWTKAILRTSMRGRVPDAILDRTDKIGFAAPTVAWMTGPLRAWWTEHLSETRCRQRGWIRPERIARLAARLDAGDLPAALTLWRLALAENWAARMLDRAESAGHASSG